MCLLLFAWNIWKKTQPCSLSLDIFGALKHLKHDHHEHQDTRRRPSSQRARMELPSWKRDQEDLGIPNIKMLPGLVSTYKKLMGKIHHILWVNQLFRLGHVQVRELWVYQRVSDVGVGLWHGVYHLPLVWLIRKKLSGIQPSTTNGISQKLYPLVICYILIENTTVIVDLPIENGGSFHSYVTVYQRVFSKLIPPP